MSKNPILTYFAPAERAKDKVLRQQSDILSDQRLVIDILNAVSTLVVILNKNRQIVFGNKAFLQMLGKEDQKDITGSRLGEVLGCIHSDENEGGCGTSKFCEMCGAVNAMLSAQTGMVDVQECRITLKEETKAFDLRVMAAPFQVSGEEFTVFSILNIADEKRKDVLERIFMHDILNTAGGLRGFSRLLTTASEGELSQYSLIINNLSDKLVSEIESHKQLMQAEKKELEIKIVPIFSLDLLTSLQESYMNHEVAKDRSILIDPQAIEYKLYSDPSLLTRVLGNMCKNALEAIGPGETVTLSCSRSDGKIRFSVHNPGKIHENEQLQIFQRSFSTKGNGRGLGTYSIKLLSEQYLQGKVGFTSTPAEGTVFFGEYPESL